MSSKSKLFLPGGARRPGQRRRGLVNPGTGAHLLCCYGECEQRSDASIAVRMKSEKQGEHIIYTFCTDTHKNLWVQWIQGQ